MGGKNGLISNLHIENINTQHLYQADLEFNTDSMSGTENLYSKF